MLYLITKLVTGFASTPHHEGDGHPHDEGDACGCLGNMDKAEQQSYYSHDMGDSCHAWDAGMDYCQPGGSFWDVTTAGVLAPGAASWCYDPVRASFSIPGSAAPPEQDRPITRLLPRPAGSGAT